MLKSEKIDVLNGGLSLSVLLVSILMTLLLLPVSDLAVAEEAGGHAAAAGHGTGSGAAGNHGGWTAMAHRAGEHPTKRVVPPQASLAEKYCSAVGDKATDARFAWQAETLKKMTKELDKRRAILEERIAELKQWVERRDRFVELGTESLVKIFESMRPDAASQQLSSVDEMTAASIITKLKARTASAILNEMDTVKAARLASTIAGAARYARRQAKKKGGGT